jgi:hypothetical protein
MITSRIGLAGAVVLSLYAGSTGLVACGGSTRALPTESAESTGTVGMQLSLPDGSSVTSVSYTVTGGPTAKSGTINVGKSSTVSAVIGGLAAGSGYMISLSGTSDGGDSCAGSAGPFTVKANTALAVSIVLTCHQPRTNGSIAISGVVDVCPGLDSINASPSAVDVGGDITITGSASPDETAIGFPLTYTWTGVTSSDNNGNATLHCATSGTFPITVAVSNGDAACSTSPDPASSVTIVVACGAGQDAGASTATDPHNCGAAGHDCLGGTCSAGLCQPTLLASFPDGPDGYVAVAAGNVYWTAQSNIYSIPASGGTVTTIAPVGVAGNSGSYGLSVNATNVFWTEYGPGTVRSALLGGGAVTTLVSGQSYPSAVVADSQTVYWEDYFGGVVWKAPIAGGTPTQLTTSTGIYDHVSFVLNSTSLYVLHWNSRTLVQLPLSGGSAVTLATTLPMNPVGLVANGSSLYWATRGTSANSYNDGTIETMSNAGGSIATLAQNQNYPVSLVVDGQHIYWASQLGGTISRSNLDGSNQIVIASGLDPAGLAGGNPGGMAQDATALYVVSFVSGSAGSGQLWKLAK